MSIKRTRFHADSVEAITTAIIDRAQGPSPVPACIRLRPRDMPFWVDITTSGARPGWKAFHLVLAAQLARTMADIEAETAALRVEGLATKGRSNPRIKIVDDLCRRQGKLARMLGLAGWAMRKRPTLPNVDDDAAGGLLAT